MRRRAVGLGAVILVGLAGAAWWWTRPAASWACQRNSPVRCQVVVNVYDIDGAPERGPWRWPSTAST